MLMCCTESTSNVERNRTGIGVSKVDCMRWRGYVEASRKISTETRRERERDGEKKEKVRSNSTPAGRTYLPPPLPPPLRTPGCCCCCPYAPRGKELPPFASTPSGAAEEGGCGAAPRRRCALARAADVVFFISFSRCLQNYNGVRVLNETPFFSFFIHTYIKEYTFTMLNRPWRDPPSGGGSSGRLRAATG